MKTDQLEEGKVYYLTIGSQVAVNRRRVDLPRGTNLRYAGGVAYLSKLHPFEVISGTHSGGRCWLSDDWVANYLASR